MNDQTRLGILARAETVPEWDRGQFIITETVKAVWAVNAQLSDQAIRAELKHGGRRFHHRLCLPLFRHG